MDLYWQMLMDPMQMASTIAIEYHIALAIVDSIAYKTVNTWVYNSMGSLCKKWAKETVGILGSRKCYRA